MACLAVKGLPLLEPHAAGRGGRGWAGGGGGGQGWRRVPICRLDWQAHEHHTLRVEGLCATSVSLFVPPGALALGGRSHHVTQARA